MEVFLVSKFEGVFPDRNRCEQSIGKHYADADGGYKAGDYIGCLIELPDRPGTADYLPHTYKVSHSFCLRGGGTSGLKK